MTSRSRTRDLRRQINGTYRYRVLSTWYSKPKSAVVGKLQYTADEVGDYEQDNPFFTEQRDSALPTLNGQVIYPGDTEPKYIFESVPLGGNFAARDPSYGRVLPNWSALASEAASRTNPSTPLVSLPSVLGEARELPSLLTSIPEFLHFRGRGLLGLLSPKTRDPLSGNLFGDIVDAAADSNLAARFGWRPFVGTLLDMFGFVDAVSQRLAWLDQLLKGKSIKRRYKLPTTKTWVDHGLKTTHSEGCVVKHRMKTQYIHRSWVTTRWQLRPGTVLPTLQDGDAAFWLAFRLALGITSFEGLQALWELTPWSWLVDWFSSVGDFLAANNRSLPVNLVSMCWMCTCQSMTLYDHVSGPPDGVSLSGEYWQTWVTKERRVISPLLALLPPFPSIPTLMWGQWSVLGSLAAQLRR